MAPERAYASRSRYLPVEKAAAYDALRPARADHHASELKAFKDALPDEMPPAPEVATPWKKRQGQAYSDRIALRRARLAGAETGRPVVRHEIIARDKSTCWICLKVVPEDEIHLDHVIPLSKGGKHDPENVKATCAPCNMWKGSRIVTPILHP